MTLDQARSVVLLLEAEPFYYRNFGVWWWFVKRELKRLGFTEANLAHLGTFEDTDCADHYYAGLSPAELDDEAFSYQADASMRHRNHPEASTPDGELYRLLDEDVE